MFISVVVVSTVVLLANANEDPVKNYSKDEFLSELDKRNNFVMFYAPWCSHCKRLTPVWEDLAKDFNVANSKLAIAKVDCTVHTELCSNQDITGYPTLKLYKTGEAEGTKFKGSRDLPTLKHFIVDELDNAVEVDGVVKEVDLSVLAELNDDNFEKHVATGNHFVKFYAPWCSHCQMLAPTWHKLAETLKDDDGITVAKIDCTKSQKVCSIFDIISYPTLLWIKDGEKVESYHGGRQLDDLKDYVSEMLQPSLSDKPEATKKPVVDNGKSVIPLTGDDFHLETKKGFTFVKFFAPWCGHCKRLAPTWEELAAKLSSEGKAKVADVDCTLEENKDLCNEQEVEGYPTLFFYRNGAKVAEYTGSRALEDLIEFVDRHSSHDEL